MPILRQGIDRFRHKTESGLQTCYTMDYLEQLLELVTDECNVHEIIWSCDFEGEFDGPVEGRFFNSLNYPVFLTNASGYMSPKIKNGVYTFIDGIEDVFLPSASYLTMWKMLAAEPDINQIMTVTRQLCATIFKERKVNNIPVKQSLQSVKILEVNTNKKHRYNPDINDYFIIELDKNITPILKKEGEARNISRTIQAGRKGVVGLGDWVDVIIPDYPDGYEAFIKRKTMTRNLTKGKEFKITACG